MTIRELIEKLSQMPNLDVPVQIDHDYRMVVGLWSELDRVCLQTCDLQTYDVLYYNHKKHGE